MVEKDNFTIYMHRCKLGKHKIYVGATTLNPTARFANGKGYGNNKEFTADIIKYGWDNFEHIILETNLTHSQAIERETYYIDKYNSTNPEFGYNIQKAGNCQSYDTRKKKSITMKGRTVSDETKEKIRLANIGKHPTEETRQKMRDSSKNRDLTDELRAKFATMKGKHHTEETKNKIKEANKGRIYVNNGTEDKMIKPEQLDECIAKGFVVGHLVSASARNKMGEPSKGTIWINDGNIVKRIKPDQLEEYLSQGFIVGRRMKGSAK